MTTTRRAAILNLLEPRIEIDGKASIELPSSLVSDAQRVLSTVNAPVTVTSVDFVGGVSVQASAATTPQGSDGTPIPASTTQPSTLPVSTTPSAVLSASTQSSTAVPVSGHVRSNLGMIIGVAVGVSTAVLLMAIATLLVYRRCKRRHTDQAQRVAWQQWMHEEREREEALRLEEKYPGSPRLRPKDDAGLDDPSVTGSSPPDHSVEKFDYAIIQKTSKQASQAKSLGPNDSVSEAGFLKDPNRNRLSFPSTFVHTEITPNLGIKRKLPWKKSVVETAQTPTDMAKWISSPKTTIPQSRTTSSKPITFHDVHGGEKNEHMSQRNSSSHRKYSRELTGIAGATHPVPVKALISRAVQPSYQLDVQHASNRSPIDESQSTLPLRGAQSSQLDKSGLQSSGSDYAARLEQTADSAVESLAPSTAFLRRFMYLPQRATSAANSAAPSSTAMSHGVTQPARAHSEIESVSRSSTAQHPNYMHSQKSTSRQRSETIPRATPLLTTTTLGLPPSTVGTSSEYTDSQINRIVNLYQDDLSEKPSSDVNTSAHIVGHKQGFVGEERGMRRELRDV